MKLHRTRTHLELRVGDVAVVDVILYIRQADLEWFNTDPEESTAKLAAAGEDNDEDEDGVIDHTTDLFQILQQSVLPRMLHGEMERSHYKQYPSSKPPPLGPHGIPILVADDKKQRRTHNDHSGNIKKGSKRKRLTVKEKAAAAAARAEEEEDNDKARPEKDVYYAFGKTFQLAYRCESIRDSNAASFVFANDTQSTSKKDEGILCELDRLPKRIVAWVFPFDPSKPLDVDPTDGGFPLPERIPIAHLFRGGVGGDE